MFYETSRHILENNYEKLQEIFLSSIDMEFNLGRNIYYLTEVTHSENYLNF